ncbi:MAG: hypothetical protein R3277_02765 [Brumimicrobium sp.]|nr:hypothetical protein [Brumimicrobium sp.]
MKNLLLISTLFFISSTILSQSTSSEQSVPKSSVPLNKEVKKENQIKFLKEATKPTDKREEKLKVRLQSTKVKEEK